MGIKKLTAFYIIKILFSKKSEWAVVKKFESNRIEHKSGVWYYDDCAGVGFNTELDHGYKPNFFMWLFIFWPLSSFNRMMVNRKIN